MSDAGAAATQPAEFSHARIILAASLGTAFEWYDFFLYGSLASVISRQFFTGLNETSGFIFALLTFAAGFAVRPIGAVIFGRLGDLIGRKKTFLATIIIMGGATTLVGVLPRYETLGIGAPVLLILLRLLQGLAIGGEYGGAAIYVAEHAPEGKRGRYTSWIQLTATLALISSLLVIFACRALLGADFDRWGWRIPFLLSTLLLAVSVYIRLQLQESPVFRQMLAEGSTSRAPLKDAFGDWHNVRRILAVLLGATAGMNVVWYGGQLYSLYFLTQILKVEPQTANLLLGAALLVGAPLFLVFGRLSDRIGRKTVILSGMALAACLFFPIFRAITHQANPALEAAARRSPISVVAAIGDCGVQFDPFGKTNFTRSCEIARAALTNMGVPYRTELLGPASLPVKIRMGSCDEPAMPARIRIGDCVDGATLNSFEGTSMTPARFKQAQAEFVVRLDQFLRRAGYPQKADPARINHVMLFACLLMLVVIVTMVNAPMGAWLVELFPARVRYTSLSVPYHIGAGWFGGFMPAVAFTLVAETGDIYFGLWYLVFTAAVTTVAGFVLLPETAHGGLPVSRVG